MMEIYLLRHGIAEDRAEGGDAQRALTDEGRKKLRRVLERAEKAGVAPSLILSSPYKRALQTAELAADVLHYDKNIVQTEALLPEARPEALWEEFGKHRHEATLLVASHEPLMSEAVAWLLGFPAMQVDMKKAALVRIDVERFGAKATRGIALDADSTADRRRLTFHTATVLRMKVWPPYPNSATNRTPTFPFPPIGRPWKRRSPKCVSIRP